MEERVKVSVNTEEIITHVPASEFEAGDFLICTLSSDSYEWPSKEVIAILIGAQHTNSEHAVAQVISQGPNVLCRLRTRTRNNFTAEMFCSLPLLHMQTVLK